MEKKHKHLAQGVVTNLEEALLPWVTSQRADFHNRLQMFKQKLFVEKVD